MCGRYRLRDVKGALKALGVDCAEDYQPRFNIAPTQMVLTITAERQLHEMIWGIKPKWGGSDVRVLINARSETVREKPSFKESFMHRRCLVPADGFYEWARDTKQPYLFELKDGSPFAIAGLWEVTEASHCCLLTTAGNEVLAPHHHRMPVIVKQEDWDEWLAPGVLPEEGFKRITTPYPASEMTATAVSKRVNNARIDDPACAAPVDADTFENSEGHLNGHHAKPHRPYDPEEESDVMSHEDLRQMDAETLWAYGGITPEQRDRIVENRAHD
jgi:putative SOS response-associated peptidase YedK